MCNYVQPTQPLSSVLAIAINLLKEHVEMDKMDTNPAHTHTHKGMKEHKKKTKHKDLLNKWISL